MASFKVEKVYTRPFVNQKPGTSGLRKPVKDFQETHFTENFIQSILNTLGDKLVGSKLAVGGDGRYFCKEAVDIIIRVAAANGVGKLVIGCNGIFSTPAVSHIIRKYKLDGGIILTASHNPGGPDADFGIKFNCDNGGPAPESVTDQIYKISRSINEYHISRDLKVDFSKVGRVIYKSNGNKFECEVICPVTDYVLYMKEIFDFNAIKSLLVPGAFKVVMNCMNGVTGPYVERIFLEELGVSQSSVVNSKPLLDFGGLHPDPNLTYAAELVQRMSGGCYGLGAAFDGDGDRNMILGSNAFFVTPSDSLAVLADNLECIPYFKKYCVKGFARSMPTAAAVDRVAAEHKKPIFEVPTGWKFFGNLMDAGMLSLCGEESFGTGSDHIREKDGIWAVLAWLSVLAYKRLSVEDLLKQHWTKYGRNFSTRYDYEGCTSEGAEQMMAHLEACVENSTLDGKEYTASKKEYIVQKMDNFRYVDPVDHTVTTNQGIRIFFTDGARIVVRLSGTGSSGATVRMYVDSYEQHHHNLFKSSQEMLQPLIDVGLQITQIKEFIGRDRPTVIT